MQQSFLDNLQRDDMHRSVEDWRLPELPVLDGMDEIIMDLESTGLRWWDGDRMIGAGLWTPDGQARYFPIRHKVGPNIDPATWFRWCREQLKGKRLVNIRTKFDLHLLREDGVDLEAQGCTFGDVAHYAALLDDHRIRFNQHDLAKDFLGIEDGKVTQVNGFTLDPTRFADYPAGLVAPRAIGDVTTVRRLLDFMWPKLTEQDLHRVREIEDAVIPCVVEMEHNGAPIDVETLNTWCDSSQRDLEEAMWQIQKESGCKLATPNNRDDIKRLFATLKIDLPIDPDDGSVSFADALLKPIEHPLIQKLRFAIGIASLRSKFLLKYQRSVARDGILRYELHQLPYTSDDDTGGGAVSGRFSSAAPSKEEGANIQQVFGVGTQSKGVTKDYIVKKLFKPDRSQHPRAVWADIDASQLQFRIFAHYAGSKDVVKAYAREFDWESIPENDYADYHKVVQSLVLEKAGKELSRTHTKNVNFAQVFGAGIPKMASQLGIPASQIPDRKEWAQAVKEGRTHEVGGPEFRKVVEISDIYHGMFPEVKPLLARAAHIAMPEHRKALQKVGGFDSRGCGKACREFYRKKFEHRGYVKTYLGRRARFNFTTHDRFYSALNRVIQGTEGDVNKRVIIEIHRMRKALGVTPRFTVHDAWNGDVHDPNPETIMALRRAFNTQYYPFKVPILWNIKTGDSWGEVK